LSLAVTKKALGFTPDSPEVKAVIEKGMKFLETANDGRLGAEALVGLCFIKHGADETHPQIQKAVAACQAAAKANGPGAALDVYSNGLAIVFLCELNPSKYQAEINALLKMLDAQQKDHGGWGYKEKPTGDTSMTQYGVLASWEAKKNGFVVPVDSVERVLMWLMRTQDPSGGWGYQGIDPGPGTSNEITLVKQKADEVRHGLSAAGLGSVYICADLLGLSAPNEEDVPDEGLPSALRLVVPDVNKNLKPLTNKIEPKQVKATEKRGHGWWSAKFKIESPVFPYYYLYALERFESFYESAAGLHLKESSWYNLGFGFLRRKQLLDGSWDSGAKIQVPDTAFAILFLMRSTKKSIEKTKGYDAGTLTGGQGLPDHLADVRLLGGQLMGRQVTGTPDALLDILSQPDHADFRSLTLDSEDLVRQLSEEEGDVRAGHLARLRRLATRGPAPSRLAAVRVLARLRDIANAPTLIQALSDSQWTVVYEADQGLRYISRRIDAAGLTEAPNEQKRTEAIRTWKLWYLSIGTDRDSPRQTAGIPTP
jgi:hypothetical protein